MDGANQKRFGVTRHGPRRTLRAGLPILQGGPPSPGQGHIACKPLRQLREGAQKLGLEFIPSYAWFAVKLLTLLLGFIWIRATFPRFRYDQVMRIGWRVLLPIAVLNLLAYFAWYAIRG